MLYLVYYVFFSILAFILTTEDTLRRRDGAFTVEALELMLRYEHDTPYSISLEDCQTLAQRLRVGMSIITFNAHRLPKQSEIVENACSRCK